MAVTTLYEFGPNELLSFISINFIKGGGGVPLALSERARNVFTNGSYSAKQQWRIALGGVDPNPAGKNCFICNLPLAPAGGDPNIWAAPQVEHLMPSAMAFLLLGLPGAFSQGIHGKISEINPAIGDLVMRFNMVNKELQLQDFDWAHRLCNAWKDKLLFLDMIGMTPGCLNPALGSCSLSFASPIKVADGGSYPFTKFIERANTSIAPGKMPMNEYRLGVPFGPTEITNIQGRMGRLIPYLTSPGTNLIINMVFNLTTAACVAMFSAGRIGDAVEILPRLIAIIQTITTPQGGGGFESIKLIREDLKLTPEEFQGAIEFYAHISDPNASPSAEVTYYNLTTTISKAKNTSRMYLPPTTPMYGPPSTPIPIRSSNSDMFGGKNKRKKTLRNKLKRKRTKRNKKSKK
jgi:hypothetical protein